MALLGRDLPTPFHLIDAGTHTLMCLAGLVHVPHNSPDDPCRFNTDPKDTDGHS